MDKERLFAAFDHGDPVALGKLLRAVEDQSDLANEIIQHTSSRLGRAHIIGITGPPGAGKSTLVSQLCKALANKGKSIGVVCIDPTSPFSGGALLGDRIRMMELSGISGVFIKSLATRGSLGGLAAATADIVRIFDAFGKDIVIVETVGVGQVELDILDVADSVVLVGVPGLGDGIQAYKAGIMEIADLYVINQADRSGADKNVHELETLVRETRDRDWIPPVIKTIATENKGITELMEGLENHELYLKESELWENNRSARQSKQLWKLIHEQFESLLREQLRSDQITRELVERVKAGAYDPRKAATEIVNRFYK